MAEPLRETCARTTIDHARSVLQRHFGYPDFREPQLPAVKAVLSGRDTLIVLPTGGGKSLCYQVPALARSGLTVVVSPLISLMADQVEALERRHIDAAFLNSTLDREAVAQRMTRARSGSLRLLYLAPERLENGCTLQELAAIGVSLLAVDEAHCISEWGQNFRPSYRRIGVARDVLGAPQTVALTATATPTVRDDIIRQLQLRTPVVVVGGFDRTNLTYHVVNTPTVRDKDRESVRWLRAAGGAAVVYTPTRRAVERVTAVLVRAGLKAVAYHAGLDVRRRQRAQDAFMHERARVIVATSAFGMGIDKPDVRLVVHHAMPGTLEAYYQEAGRAGRDGAHSTCVLMYSAEDRRTHEFFIRGTHPERALVERVWRVLRSLRNEDNQVIGESAAIAARVSRTTDPRAVESVLRVLLTAGVLSHVPAAAGRIWIRLLATPERIRAELDGGGLEISVLRTLWRMAGTALRDGTVTDLHDWPRRRGGPTDVVPVLQRLASAQFLMWHRVGSGWSLDPNARDPDWLPVDWSALAQQRRADLSRLEAMQQYSCTTACRRAFVLRYFGDPAARIRCNACDRCLGNAPPSARIVARSGGRPAPDAPNRAHGR